MKARTKKLASAFLAGVMTLSLVACGGGGDSESSKGTSSATSPDENTLTVMAWDPSFNLPALRAAEADYRDNVNEKFKLEIIEQAGAGDVETLVTTAASAGNYDTLSDIVLFQDHWIEKFVVDYPDAWQDMDDLDVNWDDFSQEKLSYSIIDGKHYGIPMDNGVVACCYRVDLLGECGYTIDDMTGITWERFFEIGKEVKEKTGKFLMCINGDGNDFVYMMLQAEGVSQFKDGKPYISENETLKQVVGLVVEMSKAGVVNLTNSWSDYTDRGIQGDQVAGIINGNWILPTIEKVEANSGKWEITTMPTLSGEEGYAANGGAALYITANCQKTELAKDFLAYTFGGKSGTTATFDGALKDGGVVGCYLPAAQSEAYNEGVEYFNNQPIYADLLEMSGHVKTIEQNPFHYTLGERMAAAITNIINGSDLDTELKDAEDQLMFEMGVQ